MRLNQMEQELQRARQQGLFASNCIPADQHHVINSSVMNGIVNSGSVAFEMEYAHWLAEENGKMNDLRTAVQNHVGDDELRALLDGLMTHYEEIYRLKNVAAKADVFHILSGMWKTPAERCFLWMGGHRPSELLKIVLPQLEPMTEQQVLGICNLQQNSQQAEDALSQGMDSLQQSLAETLSNGSLGAPGNVTNYMGQMAMAMGKLGTFESFVRQADHLRLQTLQQLQRILTTRQYSRALLATHEYFTRLRALSSLWLARPRD